MAKQNDSYNRILKSTSIFGGSQVVTIIIGIIRTKIIAVLLSKTGVGLIGVYQSIIDLTRSVTNLGIDTGGVKDIAAAAAKDDGQHLNKVIAILKQWFWLTAWIGLFTCIVFCMPISLWAFGDPQYSMAIAALSVCIFFSTMATGRSVVMQGMQRIGYMAKSAIWASFFGLLAVVPLYYFLGTEGIIPALIVSSVILYICAEYYYRKLKIQPVKVDNKEAFEVGLSTLKLGLFIVLSNIIYTVSMFLIRTYLIRMMDIQIAGLFQAVWTITTVYLGLILRSMGTDFFPRLSAIAEQKEESNKLINEQSYIVLVIASPIVMGMLLFSDWVLTILYSAEFGQASTLLEWFVLGTFLKVLSWPIAFVLLARNKGVMFLISEVLFYGSFLGVAYYLFPSYGLDAVGMGYLAAYVVYLLTVLIMGMKLTSFRWDGKNILMILVNLLLVGGLFYIIRFQGEYRYIIGSVLLAVAVAYALINLRKVFTFNDFRGWFKK
ncbi:O-antigen translocase [Dysgonomonas sp. 25]|uniref:O-antigen translocase n=1 Tax=Dysgonomonas sp. 25 TaxID=2302933 RepID=UPI0013D1D16F|nr:O-antigen translocase [Dysgonomonas sp. 25]NDV70099.1 O-antigen translocase [Dysgonomonas sp. 25]